MTTQKFYVQLLTLSGILLIVLFFLHSFPSADYLDLSLISVLFYAVLSIIMFHLGKKTAMHANKNDFSRVAFGSTFFKMMLTVVLVFIYFKIKQEASVEW